MAAQQRFRKVLLMPGKNTRDMKKKPASSLAKLAKKVPAPSIVGEKRVKKTTATVGVGPAKRKRGTHGGPTVAAAIDRRRQITGTDEPVKGGSKNAKPRGGGNPGREAVGLPGRV